MIKPTKDNLLVQFIDETDNTSVEKRKECIVRYVTETLQDWSSRRQEVEALWTAEWAHYFSTPESASWLRKQALDLGQSLDEGSWRHQIHTGKGFDLVETVNSYIQQATFPAEDWFDLIPQMPKNGAGGEEDNWLMRLERVKKLLQKKLKQANFEDWWDVFVRQLCVVGTSVMALPYRYDVKPTFKKVKVRQPNGKSSFTTVPIEKVIYDGIDLEVIDLFDFYLDPSSRFSGTADCACIRRITKTKAEVIRLIEEGVYPLIDIKDVKDAASSDLTTSRVFRQDISEMVGLLPESNFNANQSLELFEYWGDIYLDDIVYLDVVCTIMGTKLLNIETNPFWDGKPFIVGTYVNTQGSPYGVSLLQPVIGQLHQMFEVQNHRLDCDELTVNPMYAVVDDGVIDFENLYSEPGKLIRVETPDNIRPIPIERENNVSVRDEQLLDQRIEKTTGVGAYLGVNSGRDGERVTAEEVKAQRSAGGNRLNRIHGHIETTALYKFLNKMYSHLQQFQETEEIVRVPSRKPSVVYDFWLVGEDELEDNYDVCPLGSSHVADKEYDVKNAVDFVSVMSQNEQLASRVNWDAIAEHITSKFMRRDNWQKFLAQPQQNDQQAEVLPQPAAPTSAPLPMPSPEMMMPPPSQGGMGGANPELTELIDKGLITGGKPGQRAAQAIASNPEELQKFLQLKAQQTYAKPK
jgi:hypothetical protein